MYVDHISRFLISFWLINKKDLICRYDKFYRTKNTSFFYFVYKILPLIGLHLGLMSPFNYYK